MSIKPHTCLSVLLADTSAMLKNEDLCYGDTEERNDWRDNTDFRPQTDLMHRLNSWDRVWCKSTDCGGQTSGFNSWLHYLLDMWYRASHLMFLASVSSSRKWEIIIKSSIPYSHRD